MKTAEDQLEPTVFTVTGTNWTCHITMDDHNTEFDLDSQMTEAATRAVEVFKFKRDDFVIVMNPDSRDEKPKMGTVLLVHIRGTDPTKAKRIYTHVCLGNIAEYVDAVKMQVLFNKQVAQVRKSQAQKENEEQAEAKLAEDVKSFHQIPKNHEKKMTNLNQQVGYIVHRAWMRDAQRYWHCWDGYDLNSDFKTEEELVKEVEEYFGPDWRVGIEIHQIQVIEKRVK